MRGIWTTRASRGRMPLPRPRPLHRPRPRARRARGWVLGAALAPTALLGGCSSINPMTRTPESLLVQGELDIARSMLKEQVRARGTDDNRILDQARLAILTLADGYPAGAAIQFEDVYALLRQQGLNRNRGAAAALLNEDVKVWKGEPFEQSAILLYMGFAYASLGEWDNARAAADNALFFLQDFRPDLDVDPDDMRRGVSAAEVMRAEVQAAARGLEDNPIAYDARVGAATLLHAVASQQLGRPDEADDFFARTLQIVPESAAVVERIRAAEYDTLLIVGAGLGPQKVGVGPSRSELAYVARTPGAGRDPASAPPPLAFRVADQPFSRVPALTDVNALTRTYVWNPLGDFREGKASLGRTLSDVGLIGGVASAGGRNRSARDPILGIAAGLFLVGQALQAGAHVDARYLDVLPQAWYFVPVTLPTPAAGDAAIPPTVELQVDGRPGTRLVLTGFDGGPADAIGPEGPTVRYVQLVSRPQSPPAWATFGQPTIGNPVTGAVSRSPFPYVFGGDDARPPTEAALRDYQRAGNLLDLTRVELANSYRDEGLTWDLESTAGLPGLHVLQGGRSLLWPLGGTTGFARLACDPYRGVGPLAPKTPDPARTVPVP